MRNLPDSRRAALLEKNQQPRGRTASMFTRLVLKLLMCHIYSICTHFISQHYDAFQFEVHRFGFHFQQIVLKLLMCHIYIYTSPEIIVMVGWT